MTRLEKRVTALEEDLGRTKALLLITAFFAMPEECHPLVAKTLGQPYPEPQPEPERPQLRLVQGGRR